MGSRQGSALCGEQSGTTTAKPSSDASAPLAGTSLPQPSSINFDRDALFLDFDGTLAEIAPAPDLVAFTPEARDLLEVLVERFSGAVAIVTGRQMSEIDRHLAPLELPVSALYGLVHRSPNGDVTDKQTSDAAVARASAKLKEFVEEHAGLLLELKGQTIALHYRARPDLAVQSRAAVYAAVDGMTGIKVIEGKMVVEVAPVGADKGRAVRAFLKEQPFVGRRPVYIGDDISDEAAFAVVQELDGVAIKIGMGPTIAHHRSPDNTQVLQWLRLVASTGVSKLG